MMYLGNQAVGLNHTLPNIGETALLESGTYTPTEDEVVSTKIFTHSLGSMPDFLIFGTINFPLSNTYTSVYIIQGHILKSLLLDNYNGHLNISYSRVNNNSFNNATGSDNLSKYFIDNSTFIFPGPTNSKLKANVTYYYVLGKFNMEVTSNA